MCKVPGGSRQRIGMDWPVRVVSPPPARVFTLADIDEYKWFVKAAKLHYSDAMQLIGRWEGTAKKKCASPAQTQTLPRRCRGATRFLA